jgi:Uma2 family endonuclease
MAASATEEPVREGQIDLTGLALPLTLRPSEPVSDEGLMRFSEQNKPYKIERNQEGEITIMTPVGFVGAQNEGYVAAALLLWAEADGRGEAVPANAGFNLPDGACLAPDAAWTSSDRLDGLTPEQKEGYPPLCPDFIIEIRSRSDRRSVVEAKMQTWLDNGAKLAWLIDPIDRNVTIYRPNGAPETVNQPETVAGEAPVDGFVLRTARLWARN